jgi:hypothetical protein
MTCDASVIVPRCNIEALVGRRSRRRLAELWLDMRSSLAFVEGDGIIKCSCQAAFAVAPYVRLQFQMSFGAAAGFPPSVHSLQCTAFTGAVGQLF